MMSKISFEQTVQFHGHSCPGLAIGYRMALAGLNALSEQKADDEGLVAIVENDACGVDAVQMLTGCTFGKGNLLFRDYGKSVYTFFSRQSGKGVRISWRDNAVPKIEGQDRADRVCRILDAPEDALVRIQDAIMDPPAKARIHESATCDLCGEAVMATRLRDIEGRMLCIPCSEREVSL